MCIQYYEDFSKWLDKYLINELPLNIVAVNFNLYEGLNGTYDIQLIGSDEFDETDQDWACSEIFSTGEDIFYIPRTEEISDWEEGLSFITKIIENYLIKGKYAERLKKYQAVGVGFVDGDISILHHKNES